MPTSSRSLGTFVYQLKRIWMRMLRRRLQKDRFSWQRLARTCRRLWPEVRIAHPWPDKRFTVTTGGRNQMPKRARPDLCGGRRATGVPAAIDVANTVVTRDIPDSALDNRRGESPTINFAVKQRSGQQFLEEWIPATLVRGGPYNHLAR